jgi:hypothetical protein
LYDFYNDINKKLTMKYSEFKNQPSMQGRSSREIDVLWEAYLGDIPRDNDEVEDGMQQIVNEQCNSFDKAAAHVLNDPDTKMGLGKTSGFRVRIRHILRGY